MSHVACCINTSILSFLTNFYVIWHNNMIELFVTLTLIVVSNMSFFVCFESSMFFNILNFVWNKSSVNDLHFLMTTEKKTILKIYCIKPRFFLIKVCCRSENLTNIELSIATAMRTIRKANQFIPDLCFLIIDIKAG